MAEHIVDLALWPRADHFRFFRTYARPHYAVTTRMDVSRLMQARQNRQVSVYRACLFAIGAGLHAVPEMCMRFRGDTVVRHDAIALSMTVPRTTGGFGYAYVPFLPGFEAFDTHAAQLIEAAATQSGLQANTGDRDDVAYLSCLPWLDFTALDNALPHADDCIPRVSWGKTVKAQGRHEMALALQVHHALVDGEHIGACVSAMQDCLNGF